MRKGGLFLRIFSWFWLATMLLVTSMIFVQYKFSSDLVVLSAQETAQLNNMVANNLMRSFPDPYLDQRLRRRGLFLHAPGGPLDGFPHQLKHYIRLTSDQTVPMRKLYVDQLVLGPIPVTINGAPVNVYRIEEASPRTKQMFSLNQQPWLILAVVIGISGLLCFGLAWRLTRPLHQLRHTSDQLARGDLSARVPEGLSSRKDEYGQLGQTFDRMASNLQEMTQAQQRLLSDISHELRSPLARMQIAMALSRKRNGPSNELDRISREAERLEEMIAELLTLSRLQLSAEAQRETYSLSQLVDPLIEDARYEASDQDKQLTLAPLPLPEITLYGNSKLLASALENVLRNAIRYSEKEVRLSTKLDENHKQVQLIIEDDGPGVPEHALNELFRPFYRVDEARDRHSGGAGLGLAIAEAATNFHNGQIHAELIEPHGLRVIFTLPLDHCA